MGARIKTKGRKIMKKATRASIKEKIRKLFELAEHNSSPQEAKAANDKAQELKELLERESKSDCGVFEKKPRRMVNSLHVIRRQLPQGKGR